MESPDRAPDLIETLCMAQGDVPLWPLHAARLQRSAARLGYPLNLQELHDRMAALRTELDVTARHHVRLLLGPDGQLRLSARPLAATREPVLLALATQPRAAAEPLWLRLKTTRRSWYAPAQDWLTQHPAYFDVLYVNEAGDVAEGSRSNVYVSADGHHWLTPPLSAGLLPGVQRQALLDAGTVSEARLSPDDLRQAPRLRVSNALRGWLDARLTTVCVP